MNKYFFSALLCIALPCLASDDDIEANYKRNLRNAEFAQIEINPPSSMAKYVGNNLDPISICMDYDGFSCLGATTLSPLITVAVITLSTTDTSVNSVYDPIRAAKDDAQAYIATDGKEYHTAKLENAFRKIKNKYPKLNITNMEAAHIVVDYAKL